jgi:hypothetical protein
MKAGMGFYRSLGGDLGVLFNQLFVHGNELQAADKAGTLAKIAPPFDAVNTEISKSGANHPLLQEGFQTPTSARQPAMAESGAPIAPTGAPTPLMPTAPTPSKLIGAKIRALNPGSPTSGPKPGAGRLMNAILKPVV